MVGKTLSLMGSVLASGLSIHGLNPGQGYGVVFLGKTLYCHIALSSSEYKLLVMDKYFGATWQNAGMLLAIELHPM